MEAFINAVTFLASCVGCVLTIGLAVAGYIWWRRRHPTDEEPATVESEEEETADYSETVAALAAETRNAIETIHTETQLALTRMQGNSVVRRDQ